MNKDFLTGFGAGKVAGGGGGGIAVTSLSVTSNGTYRAPSGKAYSPVTVNVAFPPAVVVDPLSVNANGVYSASSGHAFDPVTVSVPNSYSAADDGKVVSNGVLVSQTSSSVTGNGTVNTTLINSLLVNVSGGGDADVVITLTQNEDEMWAPDKTLSEIIEAYDAGKIVAWLAESDGDYYFAMGGPDDETSVWYGVAYQSTEQSRVACIVHWYFMDEDGVYDDGQEVYYSETGSVEDAIINRSLSGAYTNDRVATIGNHAFAFCSNLTEVSFSLCTTIGEYAFYSCGVEDVSFPVCTTISGSAFYNCGSLTAASFSACTRIWSYAFYNCIGLTEASFPVCSSIGESAFYNCPGLTTISFPGCESIGSNAFNSCGRLTAVSFSACARIQNSAFKRCYTLVSLYLLGSSFCSLGGASVFDSAPIGGYSASAGQYGSVFVRASMLATYQSASYWSDISSRIVGLTDTQIEELG